MVRFNFYALDEARLEWIFSFLGVNDAPSLAVANCGIAVEGASDAARSAADVVFLDSGLSTIITAVKVSRQIFHRMKAYIQYRIALCLHLEIYLVCVFHHEIIRAFPTITIL